MRRFREGRFVVLASLVAIASGIGMVGAPTAVGAPGAPGACTLLTPRDLHAVLGGSVAEGSPTSSPDGSESICEWVVYPNPKNGYGAELHIYSGRHAEDFKQQRRTASAPTRNVKHVGAAAFSERAVFSGHVFDDLWVRTGSTIFRIETLRDLGTKRLIKLARIVVKNLSSAKP